jgi:hypothetical protein
MGQIVTFRCPREGGGGKKIKLLTRHATRRVRKLLILLQRDNYGDKIMSYRYKKLIIIIIIIIITQILGSVLTIWTNESAQFH